jgi:hypothetical protein
MNNLIVVKHIQKKLSGKINDLSYRYNKLLREREKYINELYEKHKKEIDDHLEEITNLLIESKEGKISIRCGDYYPYLEVLEDFLLKAGVVSEPYGYGSLVLKIDIHNQY